MFNNLTSRLSETFRRLKDHGKLNETNIANALREIRLALLEADVHYKVVKDFIERVREAAVGRDIIKRLNPSQQIVKIVYDELTILMGGQSQTLCLTGNFPLVFMLVGLQGSGKTTTSAKIALDLRKRGRRPYLVSADTQRPAAIEQLKRLGAQIQVPVLDSDPSKTPLDICLQALSEASREAADVIILDTAGRLHVDDLLMTELKTINYKIKPQEVLLVVDAMTGQDAVNVSKLFHDHLHLSGVILTKVEGDARGGAALSIKAVTEVPIKFLGMGEQLDKLEIFYPERMAGRILGMGDVLTLVEKAQKAYDLEKANELTKKLAKNEFTLDDFREQLLQFKKIGSLESVLKLLPGGDSFKQFKELQYKDKELIRSEAIINSMTPAERTNIKIINASRRKRIAGGSGTTVTDVNRLLKNFIETRKIMKNIIRPNSNKKNWRGQKFPFNRLGYFR